MTEKLTSAAPEDVEPTFLDTGDAYGDDTVGEGNVALLLSDGINGYVMEGDADAIERTLAHALTLVRTQYHLQTRGSNPTSVGLAGHIRSLEELKLIDAAIERPIMSDDYVTLTAVVRRDEGEGDPCDVMLRERDEVVFVGHQDGITVEALLAGADPSMWDDEEEPYIRPNEPMPIERQVEYEQSVAAATTNQLLDPLIAALRDANVEHGLEQTGGMTMAVTVRHPRGVWGINFDRHQEMNGKPIPVYRASWFPGVAWDEGGEHTDTRYGPIPSILMHVRETRR